MRTILCVATYLKGEAFIRECRDRGWTVLLLTAEKLLDAGWPRDAIDEVFTVRREASDEEFRAAAARIARRHHIDRVTALDDFDVEAGAMLREFLQLPGFGRTVAARFRDKLTMRTTARRLGIEVPEFSPLFTDAEIDEWANRVTPPWVVKPRSSAAATGIRKVANRDELWAALDAIGDQRAGCLVEQFVTGDVYHVDSIVSNGVVVFAAASKYGRPPMQVAHDGGVFTTRLLPDASPEARQLLDFNERLLTGFELEHGVSHSEYIGSPQGVTFLETSARVGGAYIADVVEAATGVNLWREWASLETTDEDRVYVPPTRRGEYGGIALSLARQEEPDTSSYTDPEIVTRIRKHHHAGLIVRSRDPHRVEALLSEYTERFSRDFLATMPVPERPGE
jgi:biotin carboxylase